MNNSMYFYNKVIVVTGASAGVGRATAVAFAKQGALLGLIARDKNRLEQAKQEMMDNGAKEVVTFAVDVAHAGQLEAATQAIEEKLGPIAIWVNNAMTSVFSPVKNMTPEEYKRVTDVTYLGYVYGTLAVLKRMLKRNAGVIVHVGSALAYRGIPLQSAYCAAKHAVQGFHESLRSELLHDESQVKVTMVQLPAINTPQFDWVRSRLPHTAQPVPPIYQPEVAAQAILYAAQHTPREINIGYMVELTLLLNKFIPGILDAYLAENGFKSQQTREKETADRPDNLMQPVPGKYAAHGRFDKQASYNNFQFYLATTFGFWKSILLITLFFIGSVVVVLKMV